MFAQLAIAIAFITSFQDSTSSSSTSALNSIATEQSTALDTLCITASVAMIVYFLASSLVPDLLSLVSHSCSVVIVIVAKLD